MDGGNNIKRRRTVNKKEVILGITKPAVRRLLRRAGVKRISTLIYDEVRNKTKSFLENVVRDAVTYTEHARRKTITVEDVLHSLKRRSMTLYSGFSEPTRFGPSKRKRNPKSEKKTDGGQKSEKREKKKLSLEEPLFLRFQNPLTKETKKGKKIEIHVKPRMKTTTMLTEMIKFFGYKNRQEEKGAAAYVVERVLPYIKTNRPKLYKTIDKDLVA
jgi:histone H4